MKVGFRGWVALTGVAAWVSIASTAQATAVAAWDFSQFLVSGQLTTETTFAVAQTLDANYSDLDPNKLGSPADQFGTMYLNGDFGSTSAGLTGDFVPNSNDLTLNNDALDDPLRLIGSNGSLAILDVIEGQEFTNMLGFGPAITAADGNPGTGGTVVFGADLSSVPELGQDWSLSFAGLTVSGGTSEVGVEFSTDGVTFQSLDPFVLESNAAVFQTTALGGPTDEAFFRLTFTDSVSQTFPSIDNVAISATLVSEPTRDLAMAGALLAVLGLYAHRRRQT